MRNEIRDKHYKGLIKDVDFCLELLTRLKHDIESAKSEQDKDIWDNYSQLKNHSCFVSDVIRIRRELMKVSGRLSTWWV